MPAEIRAPKLVHHREPAPCTVIQTAWCTKAVHGLSLGFAVHQPRAPEAKPQNHAVHGLSLGAPIFSPTGKTALWCTASPWGSAALGGLAA